MRVERTNRSRVFVLGLDGATFDVMQPWLEDGQLPNLSRLIRNGAAGELTSTIPPVTAPAWSSFMTGKNPGKHGLYDFMKREPGTYNLVPVNALDRGGAAIWDLLSAAGRPVVVVNVPVTYPPRPLNGVLAAGMLTPRDDPNWTYPPELADELRQVLGDYVIYGREVYSKGRVESFLEELRYVADLRLEAARYLMRSRPWDFFMIVFNVTDTVQHGMLGITDPGNPSYDGEVAQRYPDAILNVYRQMDKAVGTLLGELDDQTHLLIMSDHGFGTLRYLLNTNNFLASQGWFRFSRSPSTQVKRLAFHLGFTARNVYRLMLSLGLGRMRRTMDKRRGGRQLLRRLFLSFDDVDWSQTRAFAVGSIGGVFLNVRGREPQGVVAPGADYQRVRDEIISGLQTLQNPLTGERLVETVYRKEEIYHGPYLDEAPDIVFFPRHLETIAFGDFEFASNKLVDPSYAISGHHRMNGICVLYGPAVKSGAHLDAANILDLAPTILYLLGEPVPDDMDGRVLLDALDDEHVRLHPVRASSAAGASDRPGSAYAEDEQEEIVERLRGLGYIS